MQPIFFLLPVIGIFALLFTFQRSKWVASQDAGTDRMKRIGGFISEGAMAFLRAEYKVLTIFVLLVAGLLYWQGGKTENSSPLVAVSFVVGAFCSALAGYIGMKVATLANVRTTSAARTGLGQALQVAFTGGACMGMGVVGQI